MTIIAIHANLARTALFFAIAMAGWGLWRALRRQGLSSDYWGAAVIAEVLILAQGGLGLYLYLSGLGQLQREVMHILYGAVSALLIPGVFAFTRGDDSRRAMLIYALAYLALVGLNLRSMATGV